MGIEHSTELDEFLDDAEENGNGEFVALDGAEQKTRKPAVTRNNYASWRNVEDYLETKRLKKSLSEYYDQEE